MSANTALELEDVVFRYQEKGKRNILDHTSLSIPAGTLTVLMGGSGCGKSTLAAVAAGLYPENGGFLEGGTIRLYGQDLKTLDPQKRAAYLTVLFQNPDLQFCMNTLREEMRFCLENIRVPAGEMDARIDRAAAELGIAPLLDRTLSTLSGGEKQKAALSCLYVMESRCILLDESFANLDHEAAAQLLEMLLRMKTSGRTILAIDHKADLWLEAADEIILLEEGGKVAARGTRRKWGRTVYDAPFLVQNADADFPAGCMTAVLGPSGTGKTTTFLSVLKQHPYTGQILFQGRDIAKMKPKELYRHIGIVFQNPANQFVTQNVEDEVCVGLRLWEPGLSDEACRQRAEELLERYGLKRQRRYSPYIVGRTHLRPGCPLGKRHHGAPAGKSGAGGADGHLHHPRYRAGCGLGRSNLPAGRYRAGGKIRRGGAVNAGTLEPHRKGIYGADLCHSALV